MEWTWRLRRVRWLRGAGGSGGSGGTGGSGGSPSGTTSYAVTAVADDLDNGDLYIFASGLSSLGYSEQVRDTNVSSGEMQDYLSRDLTTLYHTGHGFEGSVATSNGSIDRSDVQINVQHTIFATCLTLTYDWGSAMGPNAQTVMGYTEVSFDMLDDNVAESFVSRLGQGHGYLESWYLSNVGVSMLADRWAAYARQGGGIVEYSARTGSTPMAGTLGADFTAINPAGNIRVRDDLLADIRTFEQKYPNAVGVAAENTTTQSIQDYTTMRPGKIDRDASVAMVEEHWRTHGGLPSDAFVERVVPIVTRTQGGAEQLSGYLVRHGRQVGGLDVRGNGAEHHLAAYVGTQGLVATSRNWPALYSARPSNLRARPMRVRDAIRYAADRLDLLAKGRPVHILTARPVLGLRRDAAGGSILVQAIELRTAEGVGVVVSALTGTVL